MLRLPWPLKAEMVAADIISEILILIALAVLLMCAHMLQEAYGRRKAWMLAELGILTLAAGAVLDILDEIFLFPQYVPSVIQNSLVCAGSIIAMVYGLNIVRGLVAAARIDGLTGLSNRRYMLESLNKEVLRAQRHGLQFSIVFLDVDNFRRVNNVLGHIQGDTVLECVSKIITSTIRGSDIASRWGGDEFVVLLAGTAREGAKAFSDRFLERLNRAIHQLEMPFEIAVSSGTSTYPEDGVTGESLLKVADYRMYQVKRARTASLKRSSLHLRRP